MTSRLRTMTRALALLGVLFPAAARAEEPRIPGEPVIMREPGDPMIIPDAADDADVFDIDLGLSYRFEAAFGSLLQGDTAMADYERLSSTLIPEARVGMFRDLAAIIRLPILLAETRRLDRADGGAQTLSSSGETLVDFPFEAPARSGLVAVTTGVAFGVMNQSRTPALPTWNVGLYLDVSAGDGMQACDPSPGEDAIECADPRDIDRDGERDPDEPNLESDLDAGLTRESVSLRAETKVSRRIRYVEPFLVLDAAFELPLEHSLLRRGGDFTLPPVRTSLELGAGLVPWENRERHTRVWLDLRVHGTFFSSGNDFTPLFDALGSSRSASLRELTTEGGATFAFDGVTVRGPRGAFGAASSFLWRASQLIRLGLDLDLEYVTEHTLALPCEDATCAALDREILSAGGELGMSDTLMIGIGANGAVMF